ncbi:hypothetical protein EDC01DRAFT_758315 [Geopyxis carbonaria]|nr:hypothetical protein EDC01DRAFT_758315 [Geopyxis carbonaria]
MNTIVQHLIPPFCTANSPPDPFNLGRRYNATQPWILSQTLLSLGLWVLQRHYAHTGADEHRLRWLRKLVMMARLGLWLPYWPWCVPALWPWTRELVFVGMGFWAAGVMNVTMRFLVREWRGRLVF